MKKLLITSSILLAAFSLHAANITLTVTGTTGAGAGVLNDSSGTDIANGNTVWVGSFNTGFDIAANATNFATLSSNFGFFDSAGTFQGSTQLLSTTTTNFGGGPGSFNASGSVADANGTTPPIYVWAFNNATPASATEWGIFTGPNLANGVAPLGVSQSVDFSTGMTGAVVGSFAGGQGTLAAIPEPSTYALIAGMTVLGFVAYRRKKTAKA